MGSSGGRAGTSDIAPSCFATPLTVKGDAFSTDKWVMSDPTTVLRNFSVLALIPLVSYLLWLDYTGRRMKGMQAENLEAARAWASERAKWGAIAAGFSQVCLFFASTHPQNPIPGMSAAIVVGVVLAQVIAHAHFESGLQTTKEKLLARSFQGLQAILWIAGGGVLCLAVIVGTVKVGFVVAGALDVSFAAKTLIALGSVVAGLSLGLLWNFALAPLHLRRILPCSPLTDERLSAAIQARFRSTGLPAPRIHVIEAEGARQSANALVAGFRSGRGPLRPALFLSRSLLQGLTDDEILAVISHEASHVQLAHLKKRMLLGTGLVAAMTIAATFVFTIVYLFAPQSHLHPWVGPIAGYVAFWMGLKSVARQSRLQEIEADIHAVQSFGATPADLASALRKLDRINGRKPPAKTNGLAGHPSTETRIQILQAYVNQRSSGKVATEAAISPIHPVPATVSVPAAATATDSGKIAA